MLKGRRAGLPGLWGALRRSYVASESSTQGLRQKLNNFTSSMAQEATEAGCPTCLKTWLKLHRLSQVSHKPSS